MLPPKMGSSTPTATSVMAMSARPAAALSRNLDNWDPALVDALAAHRRVVSFDNVGVAATTGATPDTVEAMAHGAIAFLEAMSLPRVDLLGFSIGSFIAQEIALIRPNLLRRVVLASSAPQGAAGMHGWARP